ncbi:hypothetical protein PtrM4_133880 [Pyrenophora tritici-repentis]|uniref:Uncharacterized protein n=1 Tax=Pyrenophora tritici-repentis TaxID=45151 RepID=A0A834RRA4_9PLEO|nr:hypothetical protein PtrM4_133880 [Pyrenophora tritici-repentis]
MLCCTQLFLPRATAAVAAELCSLCMFAVKNNTCNAPAIAWYRS